LDVDALPGRKAGLAVTRLDTETGPLVARWVQGGWSRTYRRRRPAAGASADGYASIGDFRCTETL